MAFPASILAALAACIAVGASACGPAENAGTEKSLQLYQIPSGGGTPSPLTDDEGADHLYPSLSPDGSQLAYQRSPLADVGEEERPAGTWKVYVRGVDGTDERLVGDFQVAAFPAWSVDGRQISFSAADAWDTFRLYTASIERGRPTAITPLGPDAMLPAWSPDGSTIAYARSPDASRGSYDLWLVNPDGTDNRSLTDDPINELRPAWSPDGKRIALVANGALSVIDAVSGRGSRLLDDDEKHADPSWSPDGTRIVFSRGEVDDCDLYTVDSDGSGLRRLTSSAGPERTPSWSHDGRMIVFAAGRRER